MVLDMPQVSWELCRQLQVYREKVEVTERRDRSSFALEGSQTSPILQATP